MTNRTPLHRRRTHLDMHQEFDLVLGTCSANPAFASEAERRQAWHYHRHRLMHEFARHGRRPCAWWQYECPVPKPHDHHQEATVLYESQLLAPEEKAELVDQWYRMFVHAQAPGFAYNTGDG